MRSSILRDLRGLSMEDRDRVRFGESAPITNESRSLVVLCCGSAMVYNRAADLFICQDCGSTDPPVEPSMSMRILK